VTQESGKDFKDFDFFESEELLNHISKREDREDDEKLKARGNAD